MKGLTLDDVCIRPITSHIKSRLDPDISTNITKNLKVRIPIVNSPMDSVISIDLANILSNSGTIPIFDRQTLLSCLVDYNKCFFISVGLKFNIRVITAFLEANTNCVGINLDIANGHSILAIETVKQLKDLFPSINIMAGAVCTAEGYLRLVKAGADVVRVGTGPGSACLTRVITGVGVPQFSAISEIYEERKKEGIPIISDGGIRNSGDIVKILAAGADSVMIGRLFAQTLESKAKKKRKLFGKRMAFYRGQASESYQLSHYGNVRTTPEGESSWLSILGSANGLIMNLCAGLKTGMAYLDSMNLDELRKKTEFMEVTGSYLEESRARIK